MTPRKRRHPLTRAEVVDAALRIVDNEGLEALSMRRLGVALGVEAMALYRHIPNKEGLLDLAVERMRSEMRLAEPLPQDPVELLEVLFSEYRRVLKAHPNMLPLATRRTDPGAKSGLEYLIDQGVDPEAAVELYQSLTAFTLGYSLLDSPAVAQQWAEVPGLAERLRDLTDSAFRKSLRALLDGYGLTRGVGAS